MTTFAELETLVVGQTRRPEVPAITQAAIRTAVLRAHHVDFFPRDLATSTLSYTPISGAEYYDFPDVSTTLGRLRSFQTIRGMEVATGAVVENLEYRELQDIYDSDNVRRTSFYTLIGDTLRIYPVVATGRFDVFFYRNPDTSSATFNSWVANTYPDDIAQWAAAIVFARTGFAEMAAEFNKNQVQPFKEILIAAHLLGTVN